MRPLLSALACLALMACATQTKVETVTVKVPVPIARECPAELCGPVTYGPLPVFRPGEGDSVTLDAEGQRRLRDLLTLLRGRDEAFRAWATAP